ncbi:MAG TPA: cupredoxin domain-containing protein [Candidatus Bathyarchaeia archaeon]|nr:cupredoxin domain-containing protein [Candidatus Bathyarchaeia archaeon]
MSEVLEPNKPALTILAIAGILIAMSITAALVIPGFQPRLVQVSSVAGGSSGGSSSPAIAGRIVTVIAPINSGVAAINFAPANFVLVIGINNTIVMKNEDTADHTMTSNPGDPVSFDTGDVTAGTTSSPLTFTTPGTYAYHCQYHPGTMHGTITVLAASS